ncbi:MAG: hypothetical protein ACK55I_37440, partial [bacterium]
MLERVAIEASKGVELCRESPQVAPVVVEPRIDEVDIVGYRARCFTFARETAVHDLHGHRRADQPRQVRLDPVAKPSHGEGSRFIAIEPEILHCALDLPRCTVLAQRGPQRREEFRG